MFEYVWVTYCFPAGSRKSDHPGQTLSAHRVGPRPFSWIPHVSSLEYTTFLACINQYRSLMAVSIISALFLGTWYLEYTWRSLFRWLTFELELSQKQVTRNQHCHNHNWVLLLFISLKGHQQSRSNGFKWWPTERPITIHYRNQSPEILREFHSISHHYCWWKKSCTTKDDDYPIVYRVLYIPGGAGFCPSTVV